jgi:hypothetical protein
MGWTNRDSVHKQIGDDSSTVDVELVLKCLNNTSVGIRHRFGNPRT